MLASLINIIISKIWVLHVVVPIISEIIFIYQVFSFVPLFCTGGTCQFVFGWLCLSCSQVLPSIHLLSADTRDPSRDQFHEEFTLDHLLYWIYRLLAWFYFSAVIPFQKCFSHTPHWFLCASSCCFGGRVLGGHFWGGLFCFRYWLADNVVHRRDYRELKASWVPRIWSDLHSDTVSLFSGELLHFSHWFWWSTVYGPRISVSCLLFNHCLIFSASSNLGSPSTSSKTNLSLHKHGQDYGAPTFPLNVYLILDALPYRSEDTPVTSSSISHITRIINLERAISFLRTAQTFPYTYPP